MDLTWWQWTDVVRRSQSRALAFWGCGPHECPYRVINSDRYWRLRAYNQGADGPAILIVAAPIKHPYIWDLGARVSFIREALRRDLRVHLIEWISPQHSEQIGLDEYTSAIGAAVLNITGKAGGSAPALVGHSLGGTFAAMYAALEPNAVQGLVLLGSPLCFRRGASPFGDAVVTKLPPLPTRLATVPGSFITQLSAMAAPEIFVWSRFADAALNVHDNDALAIHMQIEGWSLDEAPLPGRLVNEIEQWLYREDRFCREVLVVQGRTIGPSCLRVPTLAAVNTADDVASPETMTHFLNAMPGGYARVVAYNGETGVGLQHLALLVGRKARALLWPIVFDWLARPDGHSTFGSAQSTAE